ncbi:MAG TPA: alpha-L-fucosidase [Anaerolineae bacterium]|nr:alpha-L-fucosidase [Anaerolineae bacterium]
MFTPKPTVGDTSWFVEARLGMFIHWGLYALPSRHEWVASQEQIPPEAYQKYFERFNPTLYDPRQWAKAAREAGMKYVVLTSKHHEGFCLWDSAYTDYKATNTPYGKDLLQPFVEAFRAEGLRVGFYYSLLDWHHPDFPIDVFHPLRNHPDVAKLNAGRDIRRYAEYMRNQVRELLTQFDPDILWCDFSYPTNSYNGLPGKGREAWESEKLYALIRELKPRIILNNRLDLPIAADIYTPEQWQPTEWLKVDGEPVVWEACQTFSGSWGYHRDESSWKDAGQLIRMLVNTVSRGGNLLMNVGPTSLGTFDPRALAALRIYGNWMARHSESIYGCTMSAFKEPQDCRLTQKGNTLYVHIYAWPFRHLALEGLGGKVAYARFLHDGSEVGLKVVDWYASQMQIGKDTLILDLPVKQPDTVVPVVALELK